MSFMRRCRSLWSSLLHSFTAFIATGVGYSTWTKRPFILCTRAKTYSKHGTKTIHLRKTSNGTKRARGTLTVTAAGNFLMPMMIFKGKSNGKIAQCELKNFDPTSVYACQDAAWMDERCMLMWVEEIFGPYLLANPPPPGIQPVILLDA
jgi:hypothetical protein